MILDRLIPCRHPNHPRLRDITVEDIPYSAWTMGNAILGEHGCGKSAMSANMMARFIVDNQNASVVSIDKSGSHTDDLLNILASRPDWEEIRRRIKYMRLADPFFCKPIAEFSIENGLDFETQAKLVEENFSRQMDEKAAQQKVMIGAAVQVVLRNTIRLLLAMQHLDNKLPWQITEASILLDDPESLNNALNRLKDVLDEDTRRFFRTRYLEIKASERESRSYTLGMILSDINNGWLQCHLGYYRPVISIKKVIDEGQILLVDGSQVGRNTDVLEYVAGQIFGQMMAHIDLRQPHNPKNNKVLFHLDELVTILKMRNLSEALSQLASLYRSRGLMFFIILQTLTQLDEEMRKGFWSMANIYCFGLLNKADADEVAYQFFDYNPVKVKQAARTDAQNNITEPLQGQDRSMADWITHLKHRELIIRRRYSETQKDNFIRHVRKTQEAKMNLSWEELNRLKNQLMEEGGVPLDEVREYRKRRLESLKPTAPKKIGA